MEYISVSFFITIMIGITILIVTALRKYNINFNDIKDSLKVNLTLISLLREDIDTVKEKLKEYNVEHNLSFIKNDVVSLKDNIEESGKKISKILLNQIINLDRLFELTKESIGNFPLNVFPEYVYKITYFNDTLEITRKELNEVDVRFKKDANISKFGTAIYINGYYGIISEEEFIKNIKDKKKHDIIFFNENKAKEFCEKVYAIIAKQTQIKYNN